MADSDFGAIGKKSKNMQESKLVISSKDAGAENNSSDY